jgi:hypothetical protein
VSEADPDLYIDLDGAEILGNQLAQVKGLLTDAVGTIETLDGRLGSPRVVDGFETFISGWKDGRKKILGEIDEVAEKLKGSVEAYQETERRIIKAAEAGS